MSHEILAATSVRDPLTRTTRRERTSLLGTSMVGIAIAKAGLVPSKISALGIEFSQADQRFLLRALAWVVGYYLAAFAIYAASDFISSRIRTAAARAAFVSSPEYKAAHSIELKPRSAFEKFQDENKSPQDPPRAHLSLALSWIVSFLRTVFEFFIPLAVGLYAITVLARTQPLPTAPQAPVTPNQNAPAKPKATHE